MGTCVANFIKIRKHSRYLMMIDLMLHW